MSRFNLRPVAVIPALQIQAPADKKPSAYAAMKARRDNVVIQPTVVSSVAAATAAVSESFDEKPKRGRMTKDEARKHKMDLASAGIQILVVSKPNRNKIREYIKNRILQLDEEKR
jgi:hypothetical protein